MKHKNKLTELSMTARETKKQIAARTKMSLSVELQQVKQAQMEEAQKLKEHCARISKSIRAQINQRVLKSSSFVEALKSSYDLKLESKVKERERVQARVRTTQITLMEEREKELLERLKHTQMRLM